MGEIIIKLDTVDPAEFLGHDLSRLNLLKRTFNKLNIVARGNQIKALGSDEDLVAFNKKMTYIIDLYEKKGEIKNQEIEDIIHGDFKSEPDGKHIDDQVLVHGTSGKRIRARTENQKKLVKLSEENDILFAIGPAGTGKTYTAVALAVRALKNKYVKKIILTRPAVEAGERLGFLPGDLKDKVDPYLRPLYDALDDMIPPEKLDYAMTNRIIEVAPLAYMRGRTLDNAFMILDEAQNATKLQLKMFLTRIGPNAKCIITGDLTQIDLPRNEQSGLKKTVDILSEIEGIGVVYLDKEDVVRHRLVKEIISAFEKSDNSNQKSSHEDNLKD